MRDFVVAGIIACEQEVKSQISGGREEGRREGEREEMLKPCKNSIEYSPTMRNKYTDSFMQPNLLNTLSLHLV